MIFWELKTLFPGDAEFSFNRYWDLPYVYVLDAYDIAKKEQIRNWHFQEAPIALLTSVIANSNRDPKKKREPYKMDDFFLYQPRDAKNIPTSVYGAAAMELAAKNLLPPWALFVFKDLKEASNGPPPQLLAYIGDTAMILAPLLYGDRVKGMVIATEAASLKRMIMKSPCGKQIYVELPLINGKFYAQEGVDLILIN